MKGGDRMKERWGIKGGAVKIEKGIKRGRGAIKTKRNLRGGGGGTVKTKRNKRGEGKRVKERGRVTEGVGEKEWKEEAE